MDMADIGDFVKKQAINDIKQVALKTPSLNLRVARILKEQMEAGAFEFCEQWEFELIEEWIHYTFIFDEPVEKNNYAVQKQV